MFFKKKKRLQEDKNASLEVLRGLALRLSVASGTQPTPRLIAFIAARAGEGSTTLALKYGSLIASESDKKVLILDISPVVSHSYGDKITSHHTGIIDAALSNQSLETAFCEIAPRLYVARWVCDKNNRMYAERIIRSDDFWKRLFSEFNTVIIDSPALQTSFDGVALAARADATVMVVEAEGTPVPVVQKLRNTLEGAGAKIIGIVLNKRRYYIPQGVYNKL